MAKKGIAAKFLKDLQKQITDEAESIAKIGDLPPKVGQPATANIPGVGKVDLGGTKAIQESAKELTESQGRQYIPQKDYVKADPILGKQTADEYQSLTHDPDNPEVHRAYQALADETVAMYEKMLSDGVEPFFIGGKDPYAASPYLSLLDLSKNKRIGVFPTSSGFGTDKNFDPAGNPLMVDSGYKIGGQPAMINDLFRAIHDYFGHGASGVGFRASGERNAFLEHFAMMGPLARRAAASETHGQNSWLNYGPNAGVNQTAKIGDTIFADQKSVILSNELIMAGTELQKIRQKKIEQILAGDDRGLEGALSKDGSFELVHYSKNQLDEVDPKYQGTGLGGKSIAEVNRLYDERAPKRSSYGIENVDRSYQREQGLGQVKNNVRIPASQMYDLINDPDNLKASVTPKQYTSPQELATLYERAIKENGYTGFFVKHPQLGAVAQLFDVAKTETGKAKLGDSESGRSSLTINLVNSGLALSTLAGLAYAKEADASLLTLGASGAKLLGKQMLSRPNQIFTNQDLIAMGYLTDKSIASHAGNVKSLKTYIEGREKALLKALKASPDMAKKYDLMKANGFEDIIVPLDRAEAKVLNAAEALEGKVGMGTMSDLSDVVKVLQAAGIPTKGIDITGGFDFMTLINNIEENYGWAAAQAALKSLSNRADRASQQAFKGKGAEAAIIPLTMRQEAVSFTAPMSAMFMEQIRQIGLSKKVKNHFDKVFRKVQPDWLGLDHPEAYAQITGKEVNGLKKMPGTGRTAFNKLIGSAQMQNLGFPSYMNAVKVLSREGFEDIPEGVGQNIILPKEGGAVKNVVYAMDNDTYDSRLLIDDWYVLESMVPAKVLFPDLYESISKRYTNNIDLKTGLVKISKKTGKPIEKRLLNHHEIIDVINKGKDSWQEFTPKVVDGIQKYIENEVKTQKMKAEMGDKQAGMAVLKLQVAMASLVGSISLLAASDNAQASIFKSILPELISILPMKKGAPEQMKNMLKKSKGVSQKEMDLIDWDKLNEMKSITKEELSEFVEKEGPKVVVSQSKTEEDQEVVDMAHELWYGDEEVPVIDFINNLKPADKEEVLTEIRDNFINNGKLSAEEAENAINTGLNAQINMPSGTVEKLLTKSAENNPAWYREKLPDYVPDMGSDGMESLAYSDYRIEGGENYRELYFNLDSVGTEKFDAFRKNRAKYKTFSTREDAEKYVTSVLESDPKLANPSQKMMDLHVREIPAVKSGHMSDQPNNMAWARITDRTGPNGEKLLNIEESQTDAHKNEQLKKLLPKDWRDKVLQQIIKQSKEDGYDGVTFASTAKQVDEIEKWGSMEEGNVSYVTNPEGKREAVNYDNSMHGFDNIDEALEDAVDDVEVFGNQVKKLTKRRDEDAGAGILDGEQLTGMNNSIDRMQKRLEKSQRSQTQIQAMKDDGWKVETVEEEVFLGDKGLQRVVDQYTKEMPLAVKNITGQDVQKISVDGKELNYVPLKDVDVADPAFFGKAPKAAVAATAVAGAGTAVADEPLQPVPPEVMPVQTEGQKLFPEPVVVEETPEQVEAQQKKESMSGAAIRYFQEATGLPVDEIIAGAKAVGGGISEMATGNKRTAELPEDVRYLPELGEDADGFKLQADYGSGDWLTDQKVAAALMTTSNPEERKNILESFGYGVEKVNDVMVVTTPLGQRRILNRPGASMADGNTVASEIMAYGPLAKGMSAMKNVGIPAAKQAAAAFTGGVATDAAQQEAARMAGSGAERDLARSLTIGSVAGAIPLVAPAIKGAKGLAPAIKDPIEELYKSIGYEPEVAAQ